MKQMFLFATCIAFSLTMKSQQLFPKKIVQPQTLQQVVQSMPSDFAKIKGETIGSTPQTVEFKSSICWAGAELCQITQYSQPSSEKKITTGNYSWQAIMPSKESFTDAVKLYKQIYTQINNSTVSFGGKNIVLKAKYESPSEDIGFSTILFENKDKKRLQVEVQIANALMEWQVKVLVYEIEKLEEENTGVEY
jgi:hypothetical protein